ncbi:hypothetical protein ACFE04_001776 [Oxalis oulophora]
MGSQGESGNNGTQSQPMVRQNSLSMFSLTLDEVQTQLGDLGKPLSSMNLDELLKNVWGGGADGNQPMEAEGTSVANNQMPLQRQASLSLTGALSKKTVDEVWKDIQQSKVSEKKSREQVPTLGEMTLEDFLVKAGVVTETDKRGEAVAPGHALDLAVNPMIDPNVPPPQYSQQGQWLSYPQAQYRNPPPGMMGVYNMPGQPMPPQALHMGAGPMMDVGYPAENQVALPSHLAGTLSDTPTPGRKRGNREDMIEKTVERRQKRMIKNRESAARSRARKQAYTNELENKVSRLEEENERLRKRKELENMLPVAPTPEPPKYQLRRTTSAPF